MSTLLEWIFDLIGPVALLVAILASQRAGRLEAAMSNLQREHYRLAEQVKRLESPK